MRTVKASDFKARCLALMDEVARTGQPLVVTKRGKPVAELRPAGAGPRRGIGVFKDRIRIVGDIVAPLDERWEVLE